MRRAGPGTLLAALLALAACEAPGNESAPRSAATVEARHANEDASPASALETTPEAMQPCVRCHYSVVDRFLRHGMAGSVGPVGTPTAGSVTNPRSGTRYEISTDESGAWLDATFADGGRRRQRLVGRIGAGVFDTSWVGAEVDIVTGRPTGRLFFAPVETVTGRGLELSPFELREGSAGLDLPLGEGCLTCHTTFSSSRLGGAALARGGAGIATDPFPGNALGEDAFEELTGLGCEACHGDSGHHLEAVARLAEGHDVEDLGIALLSAAPAERLNDVCSRCHLQGDARIDLVGGPPDPDRPLPGQIPVLVPATPSDDFRFVGQAERLVLSECFRSTPEMTCVTCHDPHTSVAQQGVPSFDARCQTCHQHCSRAQELTVEQVTGGHPARTETGCVDCHVRRSQPFDLPHVRSADHFIRSQIPPPQDDIPHRQFADAEGEQILFGSERLTDALATPDGERWLEGVRAMGLASLGQLAEARERFDSFADPGSPGARQPTAPPGLIPLETSADFHHTRALVLLGSGRREAALSAFSDAIALEPLAAASLMGRARLHLAGGDIRGALIDTQAVIDAFPRAEAPWELRTRMAERLGRPDLATEALRSYTRAWPSNPTAWYKLGLLLRQVGDPEAEPALARARALSPEPPPGLGAAAPTAE